MTRNYSALVAFIGSRAKTPFAWGSDENDCLSFWAQAVEAQTGHNPLDQDPPLRWQTEAEALAMLEAHGGLEAAVDSRMISIPATMAKRGDGALVRGLRAVMVVEGDTLVGPGPHGTVRLPRSAMIKAWSAT